MLFVCRRGLYVFGAGASMGPALTPLSTVVVAVVVVVIVVVAAAATAGTETGC
jgi:preprotein translocase subunit Sec61beta